MNRFGVGTDSPTKRTANDIELENGLRAVSLRLDANSIRFNRSGPFSPPLSPTSLPTPSSERSEQSEISDYTFSDDDATSSNSSPPSSNAASPLLRGLDLKTDSSIAPISLSEHTFAPLSAPANISNTTPSVPMFNLLILMSRLFEAHFNLGFLFMFLSVAPYFNPGLEPMPLWKLRAGAGVVVESGALPKAVLYATAISSHLGTVAFVCTALIFFYYERFHHIGTLFFSHFICISLTISFSQRRRSDGRIRLILERGRTNRRFASSRGVRSPTPRFPSVFCSESSLSTSKSSPSSPARRDGSLTSSWSAARNSVTSSLIDLRTKSPPNRLHWLHPVVTLRSR